MNTNTNTALLSKLWEAIGYHSAQIAETGNQAPGEKLTGAMAAVEAATSTAAQPPAGWLSASLIAAKAIRVLLSSPNDIDYRHEARKAAEVLESLAAAPKATKTEPVQPERVLLSEEQITEIWSRKPRYHAAPIGYTDLEFARDIEAAAHGIQPAHKEQP